MSEPHINDEAGRGHRVRPRWSWLSVALMLVGIALIGWGIIVTSWTPALVGIVVLCVGIGAAVRGGLFYDAHSTASPRAELHDVIQGEQYTEPDPGVTMTPDEVHRKVRRQFSQRRDS